MHRLTSVGWRGAVAALMVVVGVGAGCSGGDKGVTEPPAQTPSITLTLSGSNSTIAQGASGTLTVTISRGGGFTGPVALTLEGAPTGVTGTFSPATVASGQTSSTLTLKTTSATAAGSSSLNVRASGAGVTARTASIALTVTSTVQPDFSIATSPAAVAVKQGESAASTINITRTGGFVGSVSLAVSGAPAGVTATLASASSTQGSVGLTVAAGATAAVGTHTLTITATGAGVTGSRTSTLAVTVSAGGGGASGSIVYTFCGPDSPVWLAVQDGTGPWTRVTGSTNVYRFDLVSGRGGVAYVRTDTDGVASTMIQYGTADELAAMGKEQCVSDTRKSVSGSVAGLGLTDMSSINLGGASAAANGGQSAFTLQNVPGGKRDLIATRTKLDIGAGGVSMNLDRLIVRRDVQAAAGSTLPVLDFGGTEAFAPEMHNLTVTGTGGQSVMATGMYITSNSSAALLFAETTPSLGTTRSFASIPAARQRDGDLHMLVVSSYPSGIVNPTDAMEMRSAVLMFRTASDKTVGLGPALVMPTWTTVGSDRYRVTITKQAEYSSYWTATLVARDASGGTLNNITAGATAAYVGAGATAQIDIPSFMAMSAVDGWNDDWFPLGLTYWQTSASGWEGGSITQPQMDGAVVKTAMRMGGMS